MMFLTRTIVFPLENNSGSLFHLRLDLFLYVLDIQSCNSIKMLFVCLSVCIQASSRGCQGGSGVEEVLRAEETPWRIGLHAQEPVQKRRGVPTVSSCSSLWYDWLRIDYKQSTVDWIRFSLDPSASMPQLFNVASAYCKKHVTQASCFISSLVYVITQLSLPRQYTIATCSELQGFLSASFECTKTNKLCVAPLCYRKV